MKILLPFIMTLALVASGCTNEHKRKSKEKKYAAKVIKGCAAGDGVSCYNLATTAETKRIGKYVYKTYPDFNVSEAYQTAAIYLNSECAASKPKSCRAAGDLYQNIGKKRTSGKKDYYPSHANRRNLQTGKHHRASWPLSKGYKKDRKLAVSYYGKACELSYTRACQNLGDALSEPPFEDLEQSNIAYSKAVALYQSDCEAGAKRIFSCDKAKHILVYDMKTPQSIQRGLELYKQGCLEGFGKDCGYVAQIHKNDRFGLEDVSKAKQYFQKACDSRNESPCKMVEKLR